MLIFYVNAVEQLYNVLHMRIETALLCDCDLLAIDDTLCITLIMKTMKKNFGWLGELLCQDQRQRRCALLNITPLNDTKSLLQALEKAQLQIGDLKLEKKKLQEEVDALTTEVTAFHGLKKRTPKAVATIPYADDLRTSGNKLRLWKSHGSNPPSFKCLWLSMPIWIPQQGLLMMNHMTKAQLRRYTNLSPPNIMMIWLICPSSQRR